MIFAVLDPWLLAAVFIIYTMYEVYNIFASQITENSLTLLWTNRKHRRHKNIVIGTEVYMASKQ